VFWYILCNAHALRTFLILLGICKELVQVFGVYLIKDAKISGFKTLNPKPTIPSKYTQEVS
jgi:hypothetical protein